MSEFQEGDLVRIAKQPPNQLVQVQGLRGYIDEVFEGDAGCLYSFKELPVDGRCGGGGTVPAEYLVHDDGEDLKQRKAAADARAVAYCAEIEGRTAKFTAGLEKIAEEFDLTLDLLRQIHRELQRLESQL
jgi:hypothetical protein